MQLYALVSKKSQEIRTSHACHSVYCLKYIICTKYAQNFPCHRLQDDKICSICKKNAFNMHKYAQNMK